MKVDRKFAFKTMRILARLVVVTGKTGYCFLELHTLNERVSGFGLVNHSNNIFQWGSDNTVVVGFIIFFGSYFRTGNAVCTSV